LFQPYGYTEYDRWPRIFAFVREQLSNGPAPRLLPFGCSTGEEVFTLRHYFPLAEIVGIHINSRSIALCRKKADKSRDSKIRFKLASSDNGSESFYDAVFCMSVLCHGELGTNPTETCVI
jgi:SAM-dependent methyltransferase